MQPGMAAVLSLGKSVTYRATLPEASAWAMASSSTSRSRAKFRMMTPSFMVEMVSALIIFRVSSSRGVCREMMSQPAKISSRLFTRVIWLSRCQAASMEMKGSQP